MSDMSWEHASEARAALNAIVTDPEHGVAALSNAQTMSNLLKDYLPDAPREKSILVAAAEAGLADTLRDHVAQGMDPNTAIRLTASSFSSSTPFTPEACNWVTDEIAVALGISQPRIGGQGGLGGQPGYGQAAGEGAATQMAPGAPGAGGFGQPQPTNQAPGQGYPQAPAQGFGRPGQVGSGAAGAGLAGGGAGAPGQPNPQDLPTAQGYRPGYGPAQPGAYGQPQGQGYPGQPPPQPQPYQPQQAQRFPGQQAYPGQQQPQPYQGQPGRGYPGQPAFGQPGQPAQQGQPAGWGPGGYGPGGGFGGQPPKPSGGRRGLLVGGGIIALIVVIVIAAVLLTKKTPHNTGGGGHGSPTASVSTPGTPTNSPTPTGGPEALTTIMNPAGFKPVGTSCVQGLLFGLKASTITSRIFCAKTTAKNVQVWGYQFDSNADYQAGFAHINSFTGFSKTASTCPPPSGDAGATTWHANANPKYVTRPGQTIECFLDNNKPLLIWTMPTMNVFFIARDIGKGDTISRIITWWKTVNYG